MNNRVCEKTTDAYSDESFIVFESHALDVAKS
jgi:hypothetical protein